MADEFETLFRRLFAGPDARARGAARELLDRGVDWDAWTRRLTDVYLVEPERGAAAAAVLQGECRRRKDPLGAGRFAVLRGLAVQRAGSPGQAARLLLDAARRLDANQDRAWALRARIVAVDALAHAGHIAEALATADEADGHLRGRSAALWRAVLRANRANALRLKGDLDGARAEFDRAERAFRRQGQDASAAATRLNAGVALLYGGDARGAARRFRDALEVFEALGQEDRVSEARYNLACAHVRQGSPGQGIAELERMAGRFAARGLSRREALCRMDLADALRRAGDHGGAAEEAARAAEGFAAEDARAEELEALWLAAVATATTDPQAALVGQRSALARARQMDREDLSLRLELLEHEILHRAENSVSRRAVQGLRRRARALGQTEVELEAELLLAADALARGRLAQAERDLSSRRFSRPGRPWLRVAAATLSARLDARRGNITSALARLRRIAAWLDAVRSDLGGAWLRTTFLLERLDPYLERVELLLRRGRPGDRREAEALLDALAARRFLEGTASTRDPPDLEDLRRRLEAIYEQLSPHGSNRHGQALDARVAVRRARELETEIARRVRSAERREPGRGSLSLVRPPPVAVSPDTVVVHLWRRNGQVHGVTRHGGSVGSLVDLGPALGLERQVARLDFHARRASLLASAAAAQDVEDGLAGLSDRLLAPLDAAAWPRHVRVVLDGRLPDLPLEVMPLEGRPLAGERVLLRSPSLRVGRVRALRGAGTAVIALGEAGLPGVERELDLLQGLGPVLAGARATRTAVVDALRCREVLHLCGHGFDAPKAPTVGGIRVADGWLTSADVPPRISARLVVLAACRTGSAAGVAGEAWGGLPRALLRAGCRRVLWTAGDVDDETTADLMRAFHAERDGDDATAAFGRALNTIWTARGSATLLPFRVSGVES